MFSQTRFLIAIHSTQKRRKSFKNPVIGLTEFKNSEIYRRTITNLALGESAQAQAMRLRKGKPAQ